MSYQPPPINHLQLTPETCRSAGLDEQPLPIEGGLT